MSRSGQEKDRQLQCSAAAGLEAFYSAVRCRGILYSRASNNPDIPVAVSNTALLVPVEHTSGISLKIEILCLLDGNSYKEDFTAFELSRCLVLAAD